MAGFNLISQGLWCDIYWHSDDHSTGGNAELELVDGLDRS